MAEYANRFGPHAPDDTYLPRPYAEQRYVDTLLAWAETLP